MERAATERVTVSALQAHAVAAAPGRLPMWVVDDSAGWRLECPAAGLTATAKSIPAALRAMATKWGQAAPAELKRGYEAKAKA